MALSDQASTQFWIASTIAQAIDLSPLHHLQNKVNLSIVEGLPACKAMPWIFDLFVPSEEIRRHVYWDTARDAAVILDVERAGCVFRVSVCHSLDPAEEAEKLPRALG
jgi:hypothetical protein